IVAPLLHQPQLQHLGLCFDVISSSLAAPRLPPLTPQVPQVRNAALIEREAVTLPLDYAFGFELADVGPAAIECRASADTLTEATVLDGGRIVFVPVASWQDTSFSTSGGIAHVPYLPHSSIGRE